MCFQVCFLRTLIGLSTSIKRFQQLVLEAPESALTSLIALCRASPWKRWMIPCQRQPAEHLFPRRDGSKIRLCCYPFMSSCVYVVQMCALCMHALPLTLSVFPWDLFTLFF